MERPFAVNQTALCTEMTNSEKKENMLSARGRNKDCFSIILEIHLPQYTFTLYRAQALSHIERY
jgi:hypothetical protein